VLKVDLGVLPLGELNRLFAPIEKEAKIAVAVSGGNDSLALLLLVHAWQIQVFGELEIHVYTLDHGLRPEAEKETRFVISVAEQLGFKATIVHWDGDKPKSGIQAAARAARYRLIGEAMKRDGAGILLSGHHKRDQAETVLMRLAHCSGLKGLGGMRAFSRVEETRVFRPLLGVEPEFLEQVVAKSGLSAVNDPTNDDESFERVRWRKQLPSLGKLGLDGAALSLFSQRAQRADLALEVFARSQFDRLVSRDMFGALYVDLAVLNALPEEIVLRLVGEMVAHLAGDGGKLAQLEALQKDLRGGGFETITLNGCVLKVQKGLLLAFRERGRIDDRAIKLAPGNTIVWDQRFEIHNSGSQGLSIQAGGDLTRSQAEAFVEGAVDVPMACVKSAPLIQDVHQEILALGTLSRAAFVSVKHRYALANTGGADVCPD